MDHAAAVEQCLTGVAEEGDTQMGFAMLAEAGVHALLDVAAAIRELTDELRRPVDDARD